MLNNHLLRWLYRRQRNMIRINPVVGQAKEMDDDHRKFIHSAFMVLGSIIVASLIFISGCIHSRPAFSSTDIDMQAICQIESGCRTDAVGSAGDIGAYQITPILLEDFNNFSALTNGPQYDMEDMFDGGNNFEVAHWYITERIPFLLKTLYQPVTRRNILICYNAGIRAVVRNKIPRTTMRYLRKYEKLTRISL